MSTRTYALLAIGSALGAWWWSRNRTSAYGPPARPRGTVIYDNTPVAE
jgi:hypothetical protein